MNFDFVDGNGRSTLDIRVEDRMETKRSGEAIARDWRRD